MSSFSKTLTPWHLNRGTQPIERSTAPLPKVIPMPPAKESTQVDTLVVGTPNPSMGDNSAISDDSGVAMGQSVWIPQISLELYLRATKDPAFAMRYYKRIMKLWEIYRGILESVSSSVEQIRALRMPESITYPNGTKVSLRVLQYQERAERLRQEKAMRDSACKVLGIDPKVLALLKTLSPEQIQALKQ